MERSRRADETRADHVALAAGEGVLAVPSRKRLTVYESAGGARPRLADVAPQTILAVPASPVRVRDPLLTFSSDQDGFFDCRLDGDFWAPCTSPHRIVGLADGAHTFEVRAVNVAGVADPHPARADSPSTPRPTPRPTSTGS